MARFLDSSVLVRYLTNDDPARARVAEAIIDSDDLVLSCVVLSEVAYVLRKTYGRSRRAISVALAEFLFRENVQLVDVPKERAASALLKAAESARISFGDALILAQMQASGHREIYSFDTRFRDEGVDVLQKPAR